MRQKWQRPLILCTRHKRLVQTFIYDLKCLQSMTHSVIVTVDRFDKKKIAKCALHKWIDREKKITARIF